MKLAPLLSINAVVALAYSLGLLLVPATLLTVYGLTSGPGEQLMARFFGVALVAVGLLTWLARNVADPSAQRAFILALLISQAVGLIVALLGTLSGRRDECCGLVSGRHLPPTGVGLRLLSVHEAQFSLTTEAARS